jgi:hypothetical protein
MGTKTSQKEYLYPFLDNLRIWHCLNLTSGVSMTGKKRKDFIKLLSAKGTKQVMEFVNTPLLNDWLRKLLIYGVISHHFKRVETRREWYLLRDKGKKGSSAFICHDKPGHRTLIG